jgi:putative tryptophan/tyrosine transport system substrate-binding protein
LSGKNITPNWHTTVSKAASGNGSAVASAERRSTFASGFGPWAREGALLSYGPDTDASTQRAATYVDKILRGAKPDELPIEQPTKFQLVINGKTAKSLGLDIPPTLLAAADRVIE